MTRLSSLLVAFALFAACTNAEPAPHTPTLRDFVGVNFHAGRLAQLDPPDTIQRFAAVTRHARVYHPLGWDLERTGDPLKLPKGRWDWPNWQTQVYGPMTETGYAVNAAVMLTFGDVRDARLWSDPARDAAAYGRAFAKAFGPTHGSGSVHAVQIGNEPGHMSDELFVTVFKAMAQAIREADPKLTIVSPNVHAEPSGRYHKDTALFAEMLDLVDVFAVHTYNQVRGWPHYERSFPEDPKARYLQPVQAVLAWRDEHAPGKQVWITEFGYEATTQTEWEGEWSGGVTDLQQAQYLVRSFLQFHRMSLDRAYMYWYVDNDTPGQHACSGLARNLSDDHKQPRVVAKPSFWAQQHLLATLGDYRFGRVIEVDAKDVRVFEYVHPEKTDKRIWVAWSATGEDREVNVTLALPEGWRGASAERMATSEDGPEAIETHPSSSNVRLAVTESPAYLKITRR